jgi:tetratricopeptide (TPR) repeat protein
VRHGTSRAHALALALEDEELYEVLANLGLLYKSTGEYPRARLLLEDLKKRYPEKLEGRVTLGTVYKKLGFDALAAGELLFVLARDPGNLVACNNLANVYRDDGRFNDARKYYNRCLEIDPANAVVRKNIERLEIMERQGPGSGR